MKNFLNLKKNSACLRTIHQGRFCPRRFLVGDFVRAAVSVFLHDLAARFRFLRIKDNSSYQFFVII